MSHAEKPKRTRLELAWMGVLAAGGAMVAVSTADLPINTTVADFFNGGSQPGDMVQRLASALGARTATRTTTRSRSRSGRGRRR